MRRVGIFLLVGLGVALIAVGLLFLVGSAGKAYRFVVAAAGMALGAVVTGFGVRAFRRLRAESPEQLRADILALARRRSGELSAGDLQASLGRRAALAEPVLARLVTEGVAQRVQREADAWYVFEGLQPRLKVRSCEHCSLELPISDDQEHCPSCGGALRITAKVSSVAAGEELYGMD